jgi:hypothetical protein
MQTTLRIDDQIYRRAKAKSGEMGLSLTRFFEEAVEERLTRLEERRMEPVRLPVSSASGAPVSARELRQRIEAADFEGDTAKIS